MITQWLNSIGLVFGIAGVVLLFVWGPPQPTFEERVLLGVTPATVFKDVKKAADLIKDTNRKKFHHQLMSRIGLAFLFIGLLYNSGRTWA